MMVRRVVLAIGGRIFGPVRQVGSLILIVIFFVFFGFPKIANAMVVYPAEASVPNDSASIEVFDFSNDKQIVTPLANGCSCIIIHINRDQERSSWPHRQRWVFRRKNSISWIWRLISKPRTSFFPSHTATYRANSGVGISDVRQIENETTKIISASLKIDSSDAHFGAMRSFKLISGKPNSFARQFCLSAAYAGQNNCEESNYKSRDCGEIIRIKNPIENCVQPNQRASPLWWFPWALLAAPFLGLLVGWLVSRSI